MIRIASILGAVLLLAQCDSRERGLHPAQAQPAENQVHSTVDRGPWEIVAAGQHVFLLNTSTGKTFERKLDQNGNAFWSEITQSPQRKRLTFEELQKLESGTTTESAAASQAPPATSTK